MDYSGTVDYDVNTPFKYEGDEPDTVPQSDDGGVDDSNRVPVHHHQDDLIYPPLDFATPTPQAMDNPHSVPSSNTHLLESQHTQSLGDNSHHLSNNIGTSSSNRRHNNVEDTTTLRMETETIHETDNQPEPSSPESEDLPLARRTAPARRSRGRPARSTRTNKSFAEADDDEEEEFDQKPPKGLFDSTPSTPLLGTQSIFSAVVQKERRTQLTKGAKKKKKTEPEFCRFCFTNELHLQKVRTVKLPPNSSNPNTKFTTLVPSVIESVQLGLTDKWTNPSFALVCDDCVQVFSSFYEFRTNVETNDALLRKLYCKSKAKSKKPPPSAPATPTPTPTPPPSSGKGGKRGKAAKPDPSSAEDSEAVSTVSTKQKKPPGRRGRPPKASVVTDDDDNYETDGYLSSVSKTSRKSTTSKKGGNKKKRGVTSDDDTDGYMSSVSRKSTTVTNTSAAAKNAKKKRRYNSDSDNEDVKSDISDGMDFGGPTPYESSDEMSRDSSVSTKRTENRTPAAASQSILGDSLGQDDEDDNSDVDETRATFSTNITVKKEDGSDVIVKSEPLGNEYMDLTPSTRPSRRYARDSDSDVAGGDSNSNFGNHFLTSQTKPTSVRAANLKTVLESNLGTLVNKSSAKSQNYLAMIMKNYENRSIATMEQPVAYEDQGDNPSDVEDKPLSKRKTKRRGREKGTSGLTLVTVKKEREKSVERKPRRKSIADSSDPECQEELESEQTIERRRKERRERKKKKKKVKVKREFKPATGNATGDEMSDFAFSSYDSESSESSMSEREMFGPIIYKCRHCEVTFRTYELLLRHLTGKHGGFESAALCFICGFYHKHKKMIYRHIKEHIEPKKMEKKVCDICSAEVIHLGTHQKVAHSGVTYNCKFCSMKFTRVGQMNIHIKTVHLKHMLEKKFVCQYCNKEFPFQGYLNKHMKTHNHHGNGPGVGGGQTVYTCKTCGLTFNNKHLFRNHKLVCGAAQNNTAPPPLVPAHPSTSSMSEQDVLQQQLQHSQAAQVAAQAQQAAQQAAAELSIHQIQSASFPLKLERASMYYF